MKFEIFYPILLVGLFTLLGNIFKTKRDNFHIILKGSFNKEELIEYKKKCRF